MRTTTAATNWRWQRARSTGKEKVSTKAREAVERETAFIGRRCRKCRFSGIDPRRMWKKISAKLNFAEKGAFFQTFTNCSHQTHNSAKILGYLIIKQRVLPNPMRFLPPNTQQEGPPRGGPSCVIWNERKPVRLREGRELREELLLCRLSRVLVKRMSAV